MSSIHRSYIPIPNSADGRFWCIDTAVIEPCINDGDHYYETMVFDAVKLSEEFRTFKRRDYDVAYEELDMIRTNNIDEAYENHKKMTEKWSKITRDQVFKEV